LVKDADRRSVHYDKKLDGDVWNARATAEKSFMVEQTNLAYPQQYFYEMKIKGYLEPIGFYGIEQHHYMNFGQECWALSRSFSGQTLLKEVEIKASKWLRRGLIAEHLIAIARIFGVNLVTVP